MTSQPGFQAIAILILPNKGSQTMKFGQLKEYNKINIFEARRLVPDLFLFFRKA